MSQSQEAVRVQPSVTTPVFLITIDTEGDNLWGHPDRITTQNAAFLPRFQQLCETYGFKPTYLTNYEMALDPTFQSFGHAILGRNTGEIGLHIHPWNSPPLEEKPDYDPQRDYIFLTELPDDVLRAKVNYMHELLAKTFGIQPVSHRAGRWGFDSHVARILAELGYQVDCSVTPGISWERTRGHPQGHGGTNYQHFPIRPYLMDLEQIDKPGQSSLLEVPVTIRPNYGRWLRRATQTAFMPKRVKRRLGPAFSWLRPSGRNLESMLSLVKWAIDKKYPVLEFMLHSSEFMPGGSPTFKTEADIEVLYTHLATLFERIGSSGFRGMTLAEYRAAWVSA